MSCRYEKASTVLISNKDFEQCGEILGNDVMAAALIDQMLHHCHLVNIRGNRYRMREDTALHHMLQSDVSEPVVTARRTRRSRQHSSMHEHVCNLPPPDV